MSNEGEQFGSDLTETCWISSTMANQLLFSVPLHMNGTDQSELFCMVKSPLNILPTRQRCENMDNVQIGFVVFVPVIFLSLLCVSNHQMFYQLEREGVWLQFSQLTMKAVPGLLGPNNIPLLIA